MPLPPGLVALQDVLIVLYPSEDDARQILATAGVNTGLITFSGKATNLWTDILTYVSNNEQVPELIQAALSQYPRNSRLRAVWQQWLAGQQPEILPPTSQTEPRAGLSKPSLLMEKKSTEPGTPSWRVRITEIYPSQPGATVDWNGRGGVGPDDSFIEISTPRKMSLAGYRIVVGDCEYTIAPDNLTYPLKIFWLDYMKTFSGKPCSQFPSSGTVELYDATGIPVDRREYNQPRVDESWAPLDAYDPDGPWASRSASPGQRWSTRETKAQVIVPQPANLETTKLTVTPPTVFLSYAREDVEYARKLRDDLEKGGVTVWFDKDALLPGENWQKAIEKAIKASRFFIAMVSSYSLNKKGTVQKELKIALDVLDQYPESEVYVIPVRLEDCEPSHSRLQELNWVDLFEDWSAGISRILRVVKAKIGQ